MHPTDLDTAFIQPPDPFDKWDFFALAIVISYFAWIVVLVWNENL
jgi:hypothetical protein